VDSRSDDHTYCGDREHGYRVKKTNTHDANKKKESVSRLVVFRITLIGAQAGASCRGKPPGRGSDAGAYTSEANTAS